MKPFWKGFFHSRDYSKGYSEKNKKKTKIDRSEVGVISPWLRLLYVRVKNIFLGEKIWGKDKNKVKYISFRRELSLIVLCGVFVIRLGIFGSSQHLFSSLERVFLATSTFSFVPCIVRTRMWIIIGEKGRFGKVMGKGYVRGSVKLFSSKHELQRFRVVGKSDVIAEV